MGPPIQCSGHATARVQRLTRAGAAQIKAKEAQAWCDSVALTAETEEYAKKKKSLEKLMKKLGL